MSPGAPLAVPLCTCPRTEPLFLRITFRGTKICESQLWGALRARSLWQPWPSNPCFFDLLAFSLFRSPCFFWLFSFLFLGFWVFRNEKIPCPCFFRGFHSFFSKKQGLEGQGIVRARQRSGEGVVQRKRLSKRPFLESLFRLCHFTVCC